MSNKFHGVGTSIKSQIEAIRSLIDTSRALHQLLSGGTLDSVTANNISKIVQNIDFTLRKLGEEIEELIASYDDK